MNARFQYQVERRKGADYSILRSFHVETRNATSLTNSSSRPMRSASASKRARRPTPNTSYSCRIGRSSWSKLMGGLLYARGSRTMPIFRNRSCLCGNESTTECHAFLFQLFVFGLFEFAH